MRRLLQIQTRNIWSYTNNSNGSIPCYTERLISVKVILTAMFHSSILSWLFFFNLFSLNKEWKEPQLNQINSDNSLLRIFFYSWNITMNYHIKTNTNTHKQLSRQDNDVFHFFQIKFSIKENRRHFHSRWYIILWILNLLYMCGCIKMQDLQVFIMFIVKFYNFEIYNLTRRKIHCKWTL